MAVSESALPKRQGPVEGQTVLVVDDDTTILNLTSLMLERGGFKTISAENGLKAILAVQEHPEVSAVVLDVLMPVMSGDDAFRQIREMRPELPIIVMSGLGADDLNNRFAGGGPDRILRKPFTLDGLNGTVSDALN